MIEKPSTVKCWFEERSLQKKKKKGLLMKRLTGSEARGGSSQFCSLKREQEKNLASIHHDDDDDDSHRHHHQHLPSALQPCHGSVSWFTFPASFFFDFILYTTPEMLRGAPLMNPALFTSSSTAVIHSFTHL